MGDTSYVNKLEVTCPVCGMQLGKPQSHFMKHVRDGEMEMIPKYVTVVKQSFRPTKRAADALPCGHIAAIVNFNSDWLCGECGQSVRR